MKNIFLEKSYIECGGVNSSRPFSKKIKLSISLDQQSEILYSLFLLYVKSNDDYQNIWKGTDKLLLLHIELFKKTKGGLELVSLPHFLLGFLRKIFLALNFIN